MTTPPDFTDLVSGQSGPPEPKRPSKSSLRHYPNTRSQCHYLLNSSRSLRRPIMTSDPDWLCARGRTLIGAIPAATNPPPLHLVQLPICSESMEVKAEDTLKKAAAASSGALLTSLFVTPLDVAKVRIQSQIQTSPTPAAKTLAELRVTHSTVASSFAEQCRCRTRCVCNRCVTRPVEKLSASRRGAKPLSAMRVACWRAVAPPQLQGTSHALRHIFQTEGLKGLFAGLSPAMVIAVPSTVLYYMSYDLLLNEGRQKFPQLEALAPLMAGTTARIVAASITSPIELIRTRMQGDKAGGSILETFQQAVRRGGYASLMNGLGATLARDVPFSAIYWTSYENLQRRLVSMDGGMTRTQRAFACGAVSGAIAATVTTPFDVVKTLQQVSMTAQGAQPSGMLVLRQVVASRGVSGAFTGLTARLARVAPSCAIMISCYELGKEKLGIE